MSFKVELRPIQGHQLGGHSGWDLQALLVLLVGGAADKCAEYLLSKVLVSSLCSVRRQKVQCHTSNHRLG